MINEVHFRNFKGLRQVQLGLERFTVLVGPNASGKTSILEGIHLLSRLRSERLWQLLHADEGGPFSLLSRGAGSEFELGLSGTTGAVRLKASFNGPFPEDILHPRQSSPDCWTQWSYDVERRGTEGHGEEWCSIKPDSAEGAAWMARTIPKAVLLRLDPARLADPSYTRNTRPQLELDGAGLPSVIAHMAGNRPDEFHQLQDSLRLVLPAVKRVRSDRVPVFRMEPENPSGNGSHAAQFVRRDYVGDALVFDLVGAPDIPGQMVSEGTLLVLGLLAVFLGPGHPDLLLLDDLDRGLHPRAQQDLITLLRRLLEQHPEKQIVATTHSPFLLDGLNAQEIRLTTLREDGSVACGRLVEHAQFEKWKDTMTPGELWSVFGEKWVSERQAAESK